MSIEKLIEVARLKMGPTRKARLAAARERSRIFNEQAAADFEKQKMTDELLNRRCTI